MNTYILFNIFKKQIYKFNIPLILVGYYNIFIKFGDDLFLKQCVEAGIYFVLLHDLPLQYYIDRYKILFKRYKLCLILLVCTNTYYDRLIQLSKYTNVFLYLVSSMSTTGRIFHYGTQQLFFFKLINDLNIKKVIGFGIYNNNSFKLSCNYADGVIIGSAFIKALNKKTIEYNIVSFIQIIN
jgi:tryptophan synthase alpha chain